MKSKTVLQCDAEQGTIFKINFGKSGRNMAIFCIEKHPHLKQNFVHLALKSFWTKRNLKSKTTDTNCKFEFFFRFY